MLRNHYVCKGLGGYWVVQNVAEEGSQPFSDSWEVETGAEEGTQSGAPIRRVQLPVGLACAFTR